MEKNKIYVINNTDLQTDAILSALRQDASSDRRLLVTRNAFWTALGPDIKEQLSEYSEANRAYLEEHPHTNGSWVYSVEAETQMVGYSGGGLLHDSGFHIRHGTYEEYARMVQKTGICEHPKNSHIKFMRINSVYAFETDAVPFPIYGIGMNNITGMFGTTSAYDKKEQVRLIDRYEELTGRPLTGYAEKVSIFLHEGELGFRDALHYRRYDDKYIGAYIKFFKNKIRQLEAVPDIRVTEAQAKVFGTPGMQKNPGGRNAGGRTAVNGTNRIDTASRTPKDTAPMKKAAPPERKTER